MMYFKHVSLHYTDPVKSYGGGGHNVPPPRIYYLKNSPV